MRAAIASARFSAALLVVETCRSPGTSRFRLSTKVWTRNVVFMAMVLSSGCQRRADADLVRDLVEAERHHVLTVGVVHIDDPG